MSDCVFCDKIEVEKPEVVAMGMEGNPLVVRFEPLNPVISGHMLFVPVKHVASLLDDPYTTGLVFQEAASFAKWVNRSCNLITSAGRIASQTIEHLHVHYVPRRIDDGLKLPWSEQSVLKSN
jgi:histidine triad (HIT) family protein